MHRVPRQTSKPCYSQGFVFLGGHKLSNDHSLVSGCVAMSVPAMAQNPHKLHAYMPWHMQPWQTWWQNIASHDADYRVSNAGNCWQCFAAAKNGLRIFRRFTLHILPEKDRIAGLSALLAFRQRQWSGRAHFALYTTSNAAAYFPPLNL